MKKQLEFPFPSQPETPKVTMPLLERQTRGLERIDNFPGEYIIGIDEVGIGCWAGPVTVGAVVAKKSWRNAKVKDSKQIAPKRREEILEEIVLPSIVFSRVYSMSPERIDDIGVGPARRELTESLGCMCRLYYPDALIVQDGDDPVPVDGSLYNVVCFPKADSLVTAVSAASILAKVTRDRVMKEEAKRWPQYDFQQNMGYHSASHVRALQQFGPTPIHRKSYRPVKEIMLKGAFR